MGEPIYAGLLGFMLSPNWVTIAQNDSINAVRDKPDKYQYRNTLDIGGRQYIIVWGK